MESLKNPGKKGIKPNIVIFLKFLLFQNGLRRVHFPFTKEINLGFRPNFERIMEETYSGPFPVK
jgi:hypothetical protein